MKTQSRSEKARWRGSPPFSLCFRFLAKPCWLRGLSRMDFPGLFARLAPSVIQSAADSHSLRKGPCPPHLKQPPPTLTRSPCLVSILCLPFLLVLNHLLIRQLFVLDRRAGLRYPLPAPPSKLSEISPLPLPTPGPSSPETVWSKVIFKADCLFWSSFPEPGLAWVRLSSPLKDPAPRCGCHRAWLCGCLQHVSLLGPQTPSLGATEQKEEEIIWLPKREMQKCHFSGFPGAKSLLHTISFTPHYTCPRQVGILTSFSQGGNRC